MEIKERLLNARNKKGFSLRQVGEASGIPHTNIFRYEEGVTQPSIAILEKLANIYDASPIYLAGWEKYISEEKDFLLAKKIQSLTISEQKVIEDLIDTMIKRK